MERIKRRIEKVMQQEHVHAAAAEEGLDDVARDVSTHHFVMLEIDEDRLSLRRELAFRRKAADQSLDAFADRHAF
jgi:hypothetical protein